MEPRERYEEKFMIRSEEDAEQWQFLRSTIREKTLTKKKKKTIEVWCRKQRENRWKAWQQLLRTGSLQDEQRYRKQEAETKMYIYRANKRKY